MPAHLGYISEAFQPETPTPSPIIVYIQEAHANHEGQQHLVEILEQLVQQHKLKLIMVEGGAGNVGTSHLRHYGPLAHRQQVGQRYLKAGVMTAEEYLDLASDHPLTLWGIEDAALYEQNVEAFLNAQSLQESLQPRLHQLQEALKPLAPHLYEPALAQLEEARASFDRHDMTLAAYARTLATLAQSRGVSLGAFPEFRQYLELVAQEQQLDKAQLETQQQALLDALSEKLEGEALDQLLARMQELHAGTLTPTAFYDALEPDLASAQLNFEAYPAVAAYAQHLRDGAATSTITLAEELEGLSAHLRERLSASDKSRQLRELLDAVALMERMTRFDLSPEQHQRLVEIDLNASLKPWHAFLNAELPKAGLPPASLQPVEAFIASWPELERFYVIAHQRDEALVANAAKRLAESGETLAVVITGGFHTPRMSRLLNEQGIATVIMTPKVSRATDERLYQALVRFKHGRGGTLAGLMHLAESGSAP